MTEEQMKFKKLFWAFETLFKVTSNEDHYRKMMGRSA